MNLEHVDLGLPSGTLWAKCNLGAEKETDFGLFYQWGDTQGYEGVDRHQFSWDDYKYGNDDSITKYNNTDDKLVLDNEDDPVFAATNGKFSSPTKEQFEELRDHTNHEWIEIDGVNGMKFINKNDDTKYIFIPAAGDCSYGGHYDVGFWGSVWSASRDESGANFAWHIAFGAGGVGVYHYGRCYGFSVRGVVVPQTETFDEIDDTDDGQPVDLGLPSGTLWMKSNIGATKPSDFGKFFQWGDTQGYSGVDEHHFSWNDYKWGSYKSLTKYNNTDQLTLLEPSDDSPVAATGGQASMPTKDQFQELIDNTEHRWLSLANGVNGMKFWKKGTDEPTDSKAYIFIPAAGNCFDGIYHGVGSYGYVWSTSCDESSTYRAWCMGFDADDIHINEYFFRYGGHSVRGVVVPQAKTFDEIDDTDDGKPVDLGLPSGTKWMKSNIGATKPSEFGKFFQWGDTQGYEGVDEHQFYWSDYKYGTSWENITKYNDTDHLKLLEASDDAVTGGGGSMPTKDQLQELIDNTNHEWVRLENGVNGMKFVNKSDDTKYIFIPATGNCYNGSHDDVGSWGYVWSASRNESLDYSAWFMYFDAGNVLMYNLYSRCRGFSVRGVTVPQADILDEIDDTDDGQPVDLGLPSGTLWMKSNLGGDKPSDFGLFYQWADTEGYAGVDEKTFSWSTYKYGTSWDNMTKYNNTDDKLVLDNDDDPVYTASSGQYKSPTQDQLQELMDNTVHQWVRLANGINGMKFVNRNDDTKYIFIPAAGLCYDSYHFHVDSWGCVWSSSRNSSNPSKAWSMDFDSGDVHMSNFYRCYGFSVRGVINSKKIFDGPID